MKRKFDDLKVIKSDSFNKIKLKIKMPYPFYKNLINLLKEENKFEQEYYYIERKKDFAFFILYKMKMNILTFSKFKLNLNINVVGFPCSLSNARICN